ncbi:ABC transporter permease [Herbiconiux sp. CPCC 205763]|uniref:ABC transporter permease n=1 Tax=Herbiconiux aconitum TaxID=2970913 RepID=A0ABT2GWK7_9MICO|nr:ABC transporter permease [Herbiconiux aconitum]MCS5719266.1 ABC transporter permease [Herbiconiux aconitum]
MSAPTVTAARGDASAPATRSVITRERPARSGRARRLLLGALPPVALVVLWQIAKSTGLLAYDSVPSPIDVAAALGELLVSAVFWDAVTHTLLAVFAGWAIGSAVGLVLGVALGVWRGVRVWSMTSVQVLRAIPAIAFVSLAVIVFSQTLQMEIVIAAWVAVWPVAISTMQGILGVSPLHREVAHSLRLSTAARVVKIDLPSAAPSVLVALRLSLGGALALAIVAEMIGNPAGIGYQLVQQQLGLRPDAMFAYVIVTGFIGLGLNALIQAAAPFVPGAIRRSGADA